MRRKSLIRSVHSVMTLGPLPFLYITPSHNEQVRLEFCAHGIYLSALLWITRITSSSSVSKKQQAQSFSGRREMHCISPQMFRWTNQSRCVFFLNLTLVPSFYLSVSVVKGNLE